jgi:hypothetical protein
VLPPLNTYDFFGLRIAVEMSLGPGWGGAPLGSAIVLNVNKKRNEMDVVYERNREGRASRM